MRDYVLRRLLLVPLTFVGITFVAFCFTRFVPGGPIEQALAERQQADRKRSTAARPSGPASPEELDNLKRRYGFDRSLLEAYAIWLGALPGPADWVTVRLDKDGKAEAEVADDLNPGKSFKLNISQTGGGFTLTTAADKPVEDKPRANWFATAAPLPDDPEKATRVLVYRRAYAGLLQAELGDSTASDKPVWDEIKSRLPISAWFGGWSLLLAYAISIPLGVAKALKRDGWFDRSSTQILFILYSVPGFVLAVAGLNLLCHQLHWFPSKGFDWEHPFMSTVLPLSCEMVGAFTALTLFTRNGLLDNLTTDYVRTAKAKGLSNRRIVFVHVLRNSLIPIAATFGGNLGFFLTGSFLIEFTFNIPGLGLLGYDSLVHRDYPVFLGLLTLSSLAMLIGNIVSDLCVAAVDPRIRFDKTA